MASPRGSTSPTKQRAREYDVMGGEGGMDSRFHKTIMDCKRSLLMINVER